MSAQKIEAFKEVIIQGILEKKGGNISVIDFDGVENAPADMFIICDANSNTQIRAIKDSIEEFVRIHLNDKPWHVEGMQELEWILMDYTNIVVHIFLKDKREYFNLEELWGDTNLTHIEEEKPMVKS
ncbi:MAG: ribosome silencing factor [Flavobacteriales bacterium]